MAASSSATASAAAAKTLASVRISSEAPSMILRSRTPSISVPASARSPAATPAPARASVAALHPLRQTAHCWSARYTQRWACNQKKIFIGNPSLSLYGPKRCMVDVRWSKIFLATDGDKVSTESSIATFIDSEAAGANNQLTSADVEPTMDGGGNASVKATDSVPKRSPSMVREKLKAARLISKYAETKPSPKQEFGSKVLDALRESDKGKKRSGLPEAPTNLLDDSKRGMPKQGLTFDFPGGSDLLIIIFSFLFISTVMFGTTYIVWKSGAIHFNEY